MEKSIFTSLIMISVFFCACSLDEIPDTQIVNNCSVVASFISDSSECTVPCEIIFSNNSSGQETSFWDFGDGNTSMANNPNHIYEQVGNYLVTLIVSDPNHCNDTSMQNILINQAVSSLTYNNIPILTPSIDESTTTIYLEDEFVYISGWNSKNKAFMLKYAIDGASQAIMGEYADTPYGNVNLTSDGANVMLTGFGGNDKGFVIRVNKNNMIAQGNSVLINDFSSISAALKSTNNNLFLGGYLWHSTSKALPRVQEISTSLSEEWGVTIGPSPSFSDNINGVEKGQIWSMANIPNGNSILVAGLTSDFPKTLFTFTLQGGKILPENATIHHNSGGLYIFNMKSDKDGNIYIAARKNNLLLISRINSDEVEDQMNNSIVLGNESEVKNLAPTRDGGIIVVGGTGTNSGFAIKFDDSFTEEWRQTYSDDGYFMEINDVVELDGDGYIFAGRKGVSVNHSDVLIIRTDAVGNVD